MAVLEFIYIWHLMLTVAPYTIDGAGVILVIIVLTIVTAIFVEYQMRRKKRCIAMPQR